MQIVNSYEVVKGDIRRKLEDIKGVLASTDIDEKIKDTKIVMETLPEEILSKIFSCAVCGSDMIAIRSMI